MSIWKRPVTVEQMNERSSGDPGNMIQALGIRFTSIAEDSLQARMELTPAVKQPFGFLHGGASCALAETVASIGSTLVVGYGEMECFGIELNATHLKAVRSGFVTATASPLRLGSSLHVWDVRIADSEQRLVCVSRVTIMVRPIKPEAPRA